MAFVVGGSGPTWGVIGCAVLGGLAGEVKRRRGSWPMLLTIAATFGLTAGLLGDLVLLCSPAIARWRWNRCRRWYSASLA